MQRLSCHGAGNCIQAGLGAFETAKLIVAQQGICGLWSGLGITGLYKAHVNKPSMKYYAACLQYLVLVHQLLSTSAYIAL